MTIKEAILKTLEDVGFEGYQQVVDYITKNNLTKFESKTPYHTVSATFGSFIRQNDSRVKRIKDTKGNYFYYLSKNEDKIDFEKIDKNTVTEESKKKNTVKAKTFHERDLHKLLSTYLKNDGIYSKTIFHEQSNSKDSNQVWTHPDMVGIQFLNLQTKSSQNLLKVINRDETFKISSYELKKEINSDAELKSCFFQALSNSGWANFAYLVALEFSTKTDFLDEMKRLNQSFGVGIIQLDANPFQSKVLFPARLNNLDFKTIDKLCKISKDFEKFINQTEKLMTAEERYYSATEKELSTFCDDYFETDTEIENYCKEKNIPLETVEEQENA